jgi:hypothetical protein
MRKCFDLEDKFVEVLGDSDGHLGGCFDFVQFFSRPPFADEKISKRRDLSLSPVLAEADTFLKEKGENAPGTNLFCLVKFLAQRFVGTHSANVTSPIPTFSKYWWSWMLQPPWVLLLKRVMNFPPSFPDLACSVAEAFSIIHFIEG